MAIVHLVIGLALLEYFWFGIAVARARVRYKVLAPAISGNTDFERVYRVQVNTLEQLIMFVPSILIFAHYVSELWAAVLGSLFVVGRALYSVGYTRAAAKRGTGFGLSAVAVVSLLLGAIFGAARAALG